MKIAVLTTGHRPNDDRIYYKEIISLLVKYPHVHLFAPISKGESCPLDPRVILHPLKRRTGVFGRILTGFIAATRIISLKPDVCHFHDLDFVLMLPLVHIFSRTQMIYDVHEVYPERMLISDKIPRWSRPLASRLVDIFELWLSRKCAFIFGAVDPITERLRRPNTPADTLFNYPRLSLFIPDAHRVSELKASFGDRRILLYHGTMGQDRGLFHMLDGMALLKGSFPEVLLLLVGLNDEDLRVETEERIHRFELGNMICIIPWVPHARIVDYIAIAEIGLVPLQPSEKNRRSIPLKIFEYMACGIPVLAADLPSTAQFIAGQNTGVTYDSTDHVAFARGVEHMLADRALSSKMGREGKKAVAEKWNWHRQEKTLLEAYNRIMPHEPTSS